MNAGRLGIGKNKNKVILCTIPTKKVPRLDDWPAKQSHRSRKKGEKMTKRKTYKKDSHHKTWASCTSQQTIFNGSLQRTFQSRSLLSPSFTLNGTLLISEITINWAGHLERFKPVVDDHLCLGVFFFRFRLKKQQHLQTETDIKPTCRWEKRLQMKQKERTKHERAASISVLNKTTWFFQIWTCFWNHNNENCRTAAGKRFD